MAKTVRCLLAYCCCCCCLRGEGCVMKGKKIKGYMWDVLALVGRRYQVARKRLGALCPETKVPPTSEV